MSFSIRAARPDDAPAAVPLLLLAHGSLAAAYAGTPEAAGQRAWYDAAYRHPGTRLGWPRVTLAGPDGTAGLRLAYPGRLEPALNAATPAARPLERECRDDDLYLDTLAVRTELQGRGLGTALLEDLLNAPLPEGCARISLLVEPDNEPARRLYARLGFTDDGPWTLYGHGYRRLVRPA
ncbi:MAG TPA: GNAT family N-acetyltransferase [Deinococcales bacterium]|nr:GNAT family N-acetyltransferase [Deinococcales bacterium]